MKYCHILACLLIVGVASVDAALKDQSFEWVDISAGVAGSVAICLAVVGVVFVVYEFNFRDYASEVRVDGTPFTPMPFESVDVNDPPFTALHVVDLGQPTSMTSPGATQEKVNQGFSGEGSGEVAGFPSYNAAEVVVQTERYTTRSSQIDMDVELQLH